MSRVAHLPRKWGREAQLAGVGVTKILLYQFFTKATPAKIGPL